MSGQVFDKIQSLESLIRSAGEIILKPCLFVPVSSHRTVITPPLQVFHENYSSNDDLWILLSGTQPPQKLL